MIVTLNQLERDLAVAAGTARHDQNVANEIPGNHNIESDVRGMAGEIAVCKYYGVYPNLIIGPNRLGYDLKLNGIEIDVKTTKYVTGFLTAGKNHFPQSGFIYLLVTEQAPDYKFAGWQWSETLIQEHNLKKHGYTNEQTQLHHMDELEELRRR